MYEWLSEELSANGYVQYEISNWAKDDNGPLTTDDSSSIVHRPPSFACKHNIQYWRSLPYLAFGAGAHGYANGYRYSNVLRIKTYIERLNTDHLSLITDFPLSPATVNQHKQTKQDDISEYMLNNLRLVKAGIADADFRSRFGSGLMDVYPKEINELVQLDLLEWKDDSILKLTSRGRLLGNQVFIRFIGESK